MTVSFPGGKKVDAHFGGFTIKTDQSPFGGGEGSAPQPFDLFLASIATCAGIYVKGFCDSRDLDTEGLSLTLRIHRNPGEPMISKLSIDINLPPGFPEKYHKAVIRSADLCAVKQHMLHPPAFEINAVAAS
jgi:putative redox protein